MLRSDERRRLVAFALQPLAQQLPVTPNSFRLFPRLPLRGLLVVPAHLHLAEDTLALHLLLQRAQGLVDIVVTDEHLHGLVSSYSWRRPAILRPGSNPQKNIGRPRAAR